MSTRFVDKGSGFQEPTAHAAPFGVDTDGRLKVVRGLENKGNGGATGLEKEVIPVARVIAPTASFTLTVADSGALVVFDSTTSIVATLPATQKGLKYTFVVGQLTASGGHTVAPVAVDLVAGNGFTAADDKGAVCTAATDRVGDAITVEGDGTAGWYITSVTGTWARVA